MDDLINKGFDVKNRKATLEDKLSELTGGALINGVLGTMSVKSAIQGNYLAAGIYGLFCAAGIYGCYNCQKDISKMYRNNQK